VTRPSIYEAAGGMPAFEALAAAHHARCLADPVLEHPFSHTTNPDHVHRLAAYWAEVLGGPAGYSAIADQRSLLRIHASNGAEDELGARFLACFLHALDDVGIPATPELRTALREYMTWAVEAFMAYAPYGSRVPVGVTVPHWSRDGLHAPDPPS
jgi:hemoglobin